jgi:hypothetical protein
MGWYQSITKEGEKICEVDIAALRVDADDICKYTTARATINPQ